MANTPQSRQQAEQAMQRAMAEAARQAASARAKGKAPGAGDAAAAAQARAGAMARPGVVPPEQPAAEQQAAAAQARAGAMARPGVQPKPKEKGKRQPGGVGGAPVALDVTKEAHAESVRRQVNIILEQQARAQVGTPPQRAAAKSAKNQAEIIINQNVGALPKELRDAYKKGGIDALNKAIEKWNRKVAHQKSGISLEKIQLKDSILTIDNYNILVNKGKKNFEGKYIELGGQYLEASDWHELPDKYKAIARRANSFTPMIETIKADNARVEATMEALKKYTDKKGGINLYLAIADWKEGRSKASPDNIKEVMKPEDVHLVDGALKAYDVSRKTHVALPGEEKKWINVLTGRIITNNEYKKLGHSPKVDEYVLAPTTARRKLIDIAEWVFVPVRVAKPEVELKDISTVEWAVGGAQLAILAAPFVGGAAGRVISAGAGATFGYATTKGMMDENIEMKPWQIGVGYGVAALCLIPAGYGLIKAGINRIRPGVLTGESLALTTDVGRMQIPKDMHNLAARQLVQDIERLQLNGEIPARELQPLRGVTNVESVKITRSPNGTVDIVLKSADGNAVGRISGMQRVNSDIIYHSTGNTEKIINQINDKGYFEVKGPPPRGGLFLSQQSAQQFMFNVPKGTPVKSPGIFAIRLAKGELKRPPASVMDSPKLGAMRNKMYALNEAGKLEPGVYTLFKGYGDPLTLEYELWAADGTKFYPAKSTWYAPGEVPKMKVSSTVGYDGPGETVRPGKTLPMYWLGSEQAIAAGSGVPGLKQIYAAKLLGDLTSIRQYAPWNLRWGHAAAEGEGAYAGGPWHSAIKQITLKAVPEDKAAGRVSAIVHDSEGRILLTRTQGQKRFDLPGGGVVKGKLKAEPINKAMTRELAEEVRIKPEYLDHIDTFDSTFNPGDKPQKFQIFETTTKAKPKASVEIAEYVWWDGKSRLKYPIAEFTKDAIKRQRIKTSYQNTKIVDTALKNVGNSAKKLDDISEASDELVSQSLKEAYERGYLPYRPAAKKLGAFPFTENVREADIKRASVEEPLIRRAGAERPVAKTEEIAPVKIERRAPGEKPRDERGRFIREGKTITKAEVRPAGRPERETTAKIEAPLRVVPSTERPVKPPEEEPAKIIPEEPHKFKPEDIDPEIPIPELETFEIETTPRPVPVISGGAGDEKKREIIANSNGAIAWRMGQLHGKPRWDVIVNPYKSNEHYMMVFGKPPKGATIAVGGPKSAYRTAQMLHGKPPSKAVHVDSGFQDIIATASGRNIKLHFKPDPKLETTGNISIGGHSERVSNPAPRISNRLGGISGRRGIRITPKMGKLR